MKNLPKWTVVEVRPRKDYTLLITFSGNVQKVYNARPLLDYPINAPLRDLNVFMRASVKGDTVGWPGDLDVAPEHLYEQGVAL